MANDATHVLYFAYGSNMSSRIFEKGVRRMRPSSMQTARVSGYRLTFNEPGVLFFEPGFATIEPEPEGFVEGVLYTITEKELDALHLSEGGRAYAIISIAVATAEHGTVQAFAFATRNPSVGLLPSKRYLDLLVTGARERGLSEAWIRKLEAEPHVHRPIMGRLFPFLMRGMVFLQSIGIRDPWVMLRHRRKKPR